MSGISILKLITNGLEENIQAKAISTINNKTVVFRQPFLVYGKRWIKNKY